jgi:hypothetical protein
MHATEPTTGAFGLMTAAMPSECPGFCGRRTFYTHINLFAQNMNKRYTYTFSEHGEQANREVGSVYDHLVRAPACSHLDDPDHGISSNIKLVN